MPRKTIQPRIPALAKQCSRCGEYLPSCEYAPHPNTKDGMSTWCRLCHRERWFAGQGRPLPAIDYAAAKAYRELLAADPCSYCGEPMGALDHIDPKSQGGGNEWFNLTSICQSCNSSKGTQPMLFFMGSRTTKADLLAAWRSYARWTGAKAGQTVDDLTGNLRQMV